MIIHRYRVRAGKNYLEYQTVMAIISRLSSRYPRVFLEELIGLPAIDESKLMEQEFMQATMKQRKMINIRHHPISRYKLDFKEDPATHLWLPKVSS